MKIGQWKFRNPCLILGIDGNENKPAFINHTYLLGNLNFKIIKEVQFVAQNEWIKRHEYSYQRKGRKINPTTEIDLLQYHQPKIYLTHLVVNNFD